MANLNYYKRKLKELTLTQILIGLNVLMFLITTLLGLYTPNALLILGAKVNVLIAFGDFWRLLTATFLHSGIMHLAFNMMALYIFGRDTERFYGPKKFLIIYFVSGLIGSALSYLFIPSVSVGASGAIFGLLGANLYLYFVNPTLYKRLFGSDIIILIVINVILGFTRPNIDFVGHLGGLLGGFVTAFAVGIISDHKYTLKKVIFSIVAFLLLILPIAFGTVLVKSQPDSYIATASYYYQQDNYKKSSKIIEKGLEKFPNQAELLELEKYLKTLN